MKKLIILLILPVILFFSIYLLIPAKINFAKLAYIHTNINVANRFITDESKWQKWWPSDVSDTLASGKGSSKMQYKYKNYLYTINRKVLEGFHISIENNFNHVNSFLQIISVNPDSVVLVWKGDMHGSVNPFKKISNYLSAKKMKTNMSEVVESAKTFLENKEKIYGLYIVQEKVKDTFLITTRYFSNTFPSTEIMYNVIKKLRLYISSSGALETNHPMVNIIEDGGIYKMMIAIPVNKLIAGNEEYFFKRMVAGNILVAEVLGGNYTINEALGKIKTYMDDKHLVSPAISFESLVTDRSKESDTAKWITRIYYPVI
ncbi:MAG TPA: GyrI-like domain-containing protein [Chitinophagaceae bacterium]|nr:GyrI-like domain-containing protein [Chitinophagaceae bacterium]